MAALRASDDFVLTEEMVRELLPRKSALPPGRRYAPSRSLLLRLYAGTHGAGCALQKVLKGTTPPSVREAKLVELWQKLTADYGSDPEELYVEARLVHRKRMEMGGRTPSLQLRLWLEGPPAALPTHSSPTHGSASRSPSPSPTRRGAERAWPGDHRKVRPLSPFASNSTGGLRALRIEKVDGGTPLRLRQRISDYSPAVQTPGVGEYDTTRADMGRVDLRPSASFRSTEPRGGGIEPNGDHGPQRGWNVCFYNGLPSVPRARESSRTQRGGGHAGPPFNSTELRHSGIEPVLDFGPRRGVGEVFPTFAEERRGSVKQHDESQQHSAVGRAAGEAEEADERGESSTALQLPRTSPRSRRPRPRGSCSARGAANSKRPASAPISRPKAPSTPSSRAGSPRGALIARNKAPTESEEGIST